MNEATDAGPGPAVRSLAPALRSALATAVTRPALPLAGIVAVGAWLRFTGVDWDDGSHLHPDERYLSIVADQVDWPASPRGYFDVERSPLSPYNAPAGQGYLYGTLPLVATKAVAAALGRDSYDGLYLVGRGLSALADTLAIVLVFLLAKLLLAPYGRRAAAGGALVAASLYAVAVTAIQHAHFFTVESWLVVFTLVTIYASARLVRVPPEAPWSRALVAVSAVGAGLGLTVASKTSGALVGVPVGIALVADVLRRRGTSVGAWITRSLGAALMLVASAYLSFRLVSPYAFQHSSWLDAEPSAKLRAALDEQRRAVEGEFLYPPAYQWLLSTPLVDPLRNEVVWGLGVPLGIVAVAGIAWLAAAASRAAWRALARQRDDGAPTVGPPTVPAAMVAAFAIVVFVYFGSRFVHSMRYLLPAVPILCVAAAAGLLALRRWSALVGGVAVVGVVAATLAYAIAFTAIYRAPHTRIEASSWLASRAPAGATIVSEHWDDALPVQRDAAAFRLAELPVFDADDDAKLRKLYDGLAPADYYVLSSPRAWNTIGRLPDRFPIMVRFYRNLAAGALGFREAARFTSFPRLLGVELRDTRAEETFWVYDHPLVIVYERTEPPSWPRFRTAMCRAGALPGCG